MQSNNFFGLDKEPGSYEITNYGDMLMLVVRGDADFKRRAWNMCSNAGCHTLERHGDRWHIPVTEDRLIAGFTNYLRAKLYNSELAIKEDVMELDEESGEQIFKEIRYLNEEAIELEAQRLSKEFIAQYITRTSLDAIGICYKRATKVMAPVYEAREAEGKGDEEDMEKFLEKMLESPEDYRLTDLPSEAYGS